ncbi:MAG: T9SS type A sorting domain-containing protein [Cyclobacteriaceae bacterium]
MTGSDETLQGLVSFYPNPAKNILYIERPANERKLSMVMIDAAGRELHRYDAVEVFQQVDLSMLIPGVYTIIMRSGERTASWKLVKN